MNRKGPNSTFHLFGPSVNGLQLSAGEVYRGSCRRQTTHFYLPYARNERLFRLFMYLFIHIDMGGY